MSNSLIQDDSKAFEEIAKLREKFVKDNHIEKIWFDIHDKKITGSKGGGPSMVEDMNPHGDVETIFDYMVNRGDIQDMARRNQHPDNQKAVYHLVNNSKKNPKYMNSAEADEVTREVEEGRKKIEAAANEMLNKAEAEAEARAKGGI